VEAGRPRGKPVLIAATGGTVRHSLALGHALRPLFAYLNAAVVATGVYGRDRGLGRRRRGGRRASCSESIGQLASLGRRMAGTGSHPPRRTIRGSGFLSTQLFRRAAPAAPARGAATSDRTENNPGGQAAGAAGTERLPPKPAGEPPPLACPSRPVPNEPTIPSPRASQTERLVRISGQACGTRWFEFPRRPPGHDGVFHRDGSGLLAPTASDGAVYRCFAPGPRRLYHQARKLRAGPQEDWRCPRKGDSGRPA